MGKRKFEKADSNQVRLFDIEAPDDLKLLLTLRKTGTDPGKLLRRALELHGQGMEQKELNAYARGYGDGKRGLLELATSKPAQADAET